MTRCGEQHLGGPTASQAFCICATCWRSAASADAASAFTEFSFSWNAASSGHSPPAVPRHVTGCHVTQETSVQNGY